VFDADGAIKLNYPLVVEARSWERPRSAIPDDDGRAELLFGDGSRRVRAIDFGPGSYNAGLMPWPTMHRDFLRRGSVSTCWSPRRLPACASRAGSRSPPRRILRTAARWRLNFTRDATSRWPIPRPGDRARRLGQRHAGAHARASPACARQTRPSCGTGTTGGARAAGGMYFIVATWGEAQARGTHRPLVRRR
jgi:hypothetical protein